MDEQEQGGLADLIGRVREEVRLVMQQIERSRAARTQHDPSVSGAAQATATAANGSAASVAASALVDDRESSPAVRLAADPPQPREREGYLLHLTRGGPFSRPTFVWQYFVVDEDGVRWYADKQRSRGAARASPDGSVRFFVETTNSRGSRFKKAAVCWPLVLAEDCPQVSQDATKTYFAIDYYTTAPSMGSPLGAGFGVTGGSSEASASKLFLGTNSPAERDAWVRFLRQYIDIYLAPRAESEELQHLTTAAQLSVGARTPSRPLHRSEVIDGEAPGGNYL